MTDRLKNDVLEISQRIISAQKPIRILDAIKWDESVSVEFRRRKFKSFPKLGAEFYAKHPLPFDAEKKIAEFASIREDIKRKIAPHVVADILERNCAQYEDVVRMLMARGTQDFYKFSKKLFGSAHDPFADRQTTVSQLGVMMGEIFSSLAKSDLGVCYIKNVSDEAMVQELNQRLGRYFGANAVIVKLDDGILSDAAAGSDYIKIRRGAMFSSRDIDIFEVHEGWVHVGTTMNGHAQPYCRWLAKGPPCTTAIQEGLAFLMEVFSFVCLPERGQRINNRLIACDMAESGANFLEVMEYFKSQGIGEEEAFKNTQRVFRGGVLDGGAPFTKDISYCKGFVMTYNYLRGLVRIGKPELIPFLFSGKVALEDVPILYEISEQGLLDRPKYLPRQFSDLNGLSVWMAFSNFLNKMSVETLNQKVRVVSAG